VVKKENDEVVKKENDEVVKKETDASGGEWIDNVEMKKETDASGGEWIDTVEIVVETKPAMPWLDTVSSSDSSVMEEKKEGSEVASKINAQCTNFAAMLLIEEEEIVVLKKYLSW
jgi:hypothetical protein